MKFFYTAPLFSKKKMGIIYFIWNNFEMAIHQFRFTLCQKGLENLDFELSRIWFIKYDGQTFDAPLSHLFSCTTYDEMMVKNRLV